MATTGIMDDKTSSLDEKWSALAHRYWLREPPKPMKQEALKTEIWDVLDAQLFSSRSLMPLENLQILERYLWPTFSEDVSNQHVLLIAMLVQIKSQNRLPAWDALTDRPTDFSSLFRRVLSLNLDGSLPISSRLPLLCFVVAAFQSIEKELLRKECAPLVSIAIWHNLHDEEAQTRALESRPNFRKTWRAAQKRFEAGDQEAKSKIRFERAWLYSMIVYFMSQLNTPQILETNEITYCERFLEFLIDLLSQLPTRRYTVSLINDLHLLSVIRLSKLFKDERGVNFRDLSKLFRHFLSSNFDESKNIETERQSNYSDHYKSLSQLQRVSMKHFEAKLKVLSLSNFASIDQKGDLEGHLQVLSDSELQRFCLLLGFRTAFPNHANVPVGRELFLDAISSQYGPPEGFQEAVAGLAVLPTETSLFDPSLMRTEYYDGSKPLAIPKLNLQYLTFGDFLWRSFVLYQSEAMYGIRKDVESTIKRMKPRPGKDRDGIMFDGVSKMGMPVEKPAIIEVGQPKVGKVSPSFVRAEIILEVSRLNDTMRRGWDELRPNDIVFLLSVKVSNQASHMFENGHSNSRDAPAWEISHVRCAEVVQILDDKGGNLREARNGQQNGFSSRRQLRRLLVNIDPIAYKTDLDRVANGKPDIISSINAVVRRQGRENNFKPVLETIQKLVSGQTELPAWLQDVFLGYGDPRSASFKSHSLPVPLSFDFRDTFVDWDHLQESFPGRITSVNLQDSNPAPPYVLKLNSGNVNAQKNVPRKRQREQMEDESTVLDPIHVTTYSPPNTGPYPSDIPSLNAIRFTPKQIEAIVSGIHPGLTVIVGPPGTGKTDVAAQLINLLCSNYPEQRILLVAHSNQALNQLFQKITALDIDPRYLLRLGHGEEELETETSYSKAGRVESFFENRQKYLAEVNRLAASIGAQGAHGSSCETAEYFNQVYIEPAWTEFWNHVKSDSASRESITLSFPFQKYFSNTPVPSLFPPDASSIELIDIAKGCQHHISHIFTELSAVRPFEILRQPRDQANHLLVKEARIVAMTSTHAAMRRSEIAELGFHYDTLIMEEAAQITEIESFIPCAMQKPNPKTGELPLSRIVLVGDHLQNSPIIQNLALRQYANFEQSYFLRLVRLGVPTINLDQQGRCRPSIADLFRWRYTNLGDLPHITESKEFARANAGFAYDYQFIDVGDYQGHGEREPSPHFIQNLGEAEYVVALFQYMRLLGYPARSISILTTYAGQRALIKDVLDHRCKNNRMFGLPRMVTTVDKYQGEQNDYVIVSMTRTRSVGYLRDIRRLTVALSRARLGLYILGRRDLFASCLEMKPAMDILAKRPDKLMLTTGEMFPTTRSLDEVVTATAMEGVEHLGQYVFEMTQAKVKALGGQLALATVQEGDHDLFHEDPVGVAGDVDEEDPLHEGD